MKHHHHHHHDEVRLPLRLAVEPFARTSLASPSCVALSLPQQYGRPPQQQPQPQQPQRDVAMLVDDRGILALAVDDTTTVCTTKKPGVLSRRDLVELLQPTPEQQDWLFSRIFPPSQPVLLLVRNSHSNANANINNHHRGDFFQWQILLPAQPSDTNQEETLVSDGNNSDNTLNIQDYLQPIHNQASAEWITRAIRHYYAQQVLEPSVRGFLTVLEKQFAQSNLYLFELLQNAVDDGATHVSFAALSAEECLEMTHNGRPFTPLDVLGLSSVGLSTKSTHGKRTIGFMGVGFKAVYKRYAKVTIYDGVYAFSYQEPPTTSQQNTTITAAVSSASYGWVMMPLWQPPQFNNNNNINGGCKFRLEKPRGGFQAILQDLAVLPKTAPPLLGRAALVKQQQQQQNTSSNNNNSQVWTLDWNGKIHHVRRTHIQQHGTIGMSEIVTVDILTNKQNHSGTHRQQQQQQRRQQKWLFVTYEYTPTPSALESYHRHTKRTHTGKEQVCGFVPLTATGEIDITTTSNNRGGVLHSVLPTKIRLPIPLHLQGNFLLSVDRQQVQDLSDNAWNLDILTQLPYLLALIFHWAAASSPSSSSSSSSSSLPRTRTQTNSNYRAIANLLPRPISAADPITSLILNQSISLQPLQRILYTERVLPVAVVPGPTAMNKQNVVDRTDASSCTEATIAASATDYYEGSKTIWVPPIFHKLLSPDLLRGWLGKRPLRTDAFGGGTTNDDENGGAYHPFFRHIVEQLHPSLLTHRRGQLSDQLQLSQRGVTSEAIQTLVQMMAAIGIAYEELPPHMKLQETTKNVTVKNSGGRAEDKDVIPGPCFPLSSDVWHVFLNDQGRLAAIHEVIIPGEDFAVVPDELLMLFRPYMLTADGNNSAVPLTNGGVFKKKGDKRKCKQSNVSSMLHPQLERIICAIEAGKPPEDLGLFSNGTTWSLLTAGTMSFLKRVRSENPKKVVNIATAVSNLLSAYSKEQICSANHIANVVTIAKYAIDTGNQNLLSYVLVDSSKGTKLVPAAQAYLGKAFDESGPGADLQNFAGSRLDFLSSAYLPLLGSPAKRRKFSILVMSSGVQTGLAVTISAVFDLQREKDLLASVLPHLPDRRLPQCRNKNPKADIALPYGLGVTMSRKNYSLLDSELAPEWEQLIETMSPESATGFVSLLLAIPVEDATNVTKSSVPALSMCLAGQGASNSDENSSASRAGNRCFARFPNDASVPLRRRLFFLPPGQPGAKALDVSKSRIITQLERMKWLPCKVPSAPEEGLVLLCPEEALLVADSTRPEMPVVDLPQALKTRFQESLLAKSLTFGIRAPPPPVAELGALANEATALLSGSAPNVVAEKIAIISKKMVSVWSAIARAHLRDGLSPSDRRKLHSLCQSSTSSCVPVRRALESCESSWIVPAYRCVRMSSTPPPSSGNQHERLQYFTISSLVSSNFMSDFLSQVHNPFFAHPDVSMAVQELAGIQGVTDIKTKALTRACGQFIRYCCVEEPSVPNRLSPLRASFSYAMKWCIESPNELPRENGGLKVLVRGFGLGSKGLPRRWIFLKGDKVKPVLDDNRSRSSLISPEMAIQCLALLNHSETENDVANSRILAQIDKEVIDYLGIWRLSDSRFTVKTKARGAGEVVANAASKLQLVCALLKAIELGSDNQNTPENPFLKIDYDPPPIIRHESLSREFKGPTMETPVLTPMYAVFGKAPKITKGRCVLVSGEPDDYSMELEELILHHVGARASGGNPPKQQRAALRLLSHLENDSSFEKFVNRDFKEFEATRIWRRLMERRAALEQLREAETSRDMKALREILIVAEELCDDDPDGGDAVLDSARRMLSRLEEEAEKARTKRRTSLLEELKTAALEGDEHKLRTLVLSAEKVFENISDIDGEEEAVIRDAKRRLAECLESAAAATKKLKSAEVTDSSLSTQAKMQLATDNGNSAGSGLGRGRGRTLPAWMTSQDGPTPSPMENVIKVGADSLGTIPMNGHDSDASAPAVTATDTLIMETTKALGTGRGRGRTLPAWMTTKDGPATGPGGIGALSDDSKQHAAPSSDVKVESGATTQPTIDTAACMVLPDPLRCAGRGRGRGKTLPAWMTAKGPVEDRRDVVAQAADNTNNRLMNLDDGTEEALREEAKNILSSILKSHTEPLLEPSAQDGSGLLSDDESFFANVKQAAPQEETLIATGRGRGLSRTLPSWMTSHNESDTVGPKRSRLHLEQGEQDKETVEGNERKKLRSETDKATLSSFEYSIKLQIDPIKEQAFVQWLKPAIETEAKARGGSVTLIPAQFED